jgi:hypothetical protein
MTVQEMIDRLSEYNPKSKVLLSNGGIPHNYSEIEVCGYDPDEVDYQEGNTEACPVELETIE